MIVKISYDEGCNFCRRGKLSRSEQSLIYPYKKVLNFSIFSGGLTAVICPDCLAELMIKASEIGFLNDTLSIIDLSKFGRVEICRNERDAFHIKITTGYKAEFYDELLKVIHSKVPFNTIERIVNKENLFDYIFKN